MPAAKKPGAGGLVAQLTAQAPKKNVNNTVPFPRYYRSLDLLMTQVRATQSHSMHHRCSSGLDPLIEASYVLCAADQPIPGSTKRGAVVCNVGALLQVGVDKCVLCADTLCM
jgi:hypothetical protein